MAQVYSHRLFLGSIAAGTVVTAYTVPTGYTAILRDWSFLAFGGSGPWVINMEINGTSFDFGEPTLSVPWEGINRRVVLAPGDVLDIGAAAGGGGLGQVSGYLLGT